MRMFTAIPQAFIDIEDFNASLRYGRKAYKLLKNQKEEDKEPIKFLLITGVFMRTVRFPFCYFWLQLPTTFFVVSVF